MAKNVRISQTLYNLAKSQAKLKERSIAQQIEYWAKLGMAVTKIHWDDDDNDDDKELKDDEDLTNNTKNTGNSQKKKTASIKKSKNKNNKNLSSSSKKLKEKEARLLKEIKNQNINVAGLEFVADSEKDQEQDRIDIKSGKISAEDLYWFNEDNINGFKHEEKLQDFSMFDYSDK